MVSYAKQFSSGYAAMEFYSFMAGGKSQPQFSHTKEPVRAGSGHVFGAEGSDSTGVNFLASG